jgi:hypothetical protein
MDDAKNRKKPEGVDYSKLPHKDWDSWVYVNDCDIALRDPRERYIITMQVFMWGFMIPLHVAVPSPIF